ncbi:peptidase S8 and S53 subtilisin kexin sedolisin [Leptolyngbya sp. 'hensonii']|uniref:S8 family serine peptidase n=1 Tax=Leptolyngbya sp. 'hensonii' TaxID=1922337 RepID=UPI00094FCBBE|nr:S8 family serine peptidase [Leptolyngbya sp. 'hensonii']OLP16479.1 peptidase S8 and S53 subtilisin kexin sedolisin [Leptolyngbya sp. 'hensonii']
MIKTTAWVFGALGAMWLGLTPVALSNLMQQSSIGELGIDALKLHGPPYNLTGRKIAIGQVEIGRPGQFGIDKAVSRNRGVSVMRVFFRNVPAKVNVNLDPHAQNVASIMIGNDKALQGVAPDARLYASAVGLMKRNGQPEECLSTQHVAQQNGGDVRAINFSFGESLREDPRPQAVLDGNALLTQCLDWSARVHDVVYVVAGNQGKGGIPIPTDNFNGVNVAFSSRYRPNLEAGESQGLGLFSKVDFANLGDTVSSFASRVSGIENNIGPRRAISLVAPGNGVPIMNPDGKVTRGSGTSFAAPHVTATVALLQEHGDRQLRTRQPNWSTDSRRHEVMKAILMNSADKIKDSGDGLFLGMSRTLLNKANQDWLTSDAYQDRIIPLDMQMGTGHLNAFRAYLQLSPGQFGPGPAIPPIGWDYRSVGAPSGTGKLPAFRDYVLERPLKAGSFVSLTLVWDRVVELKDLNNNGEFDLGEGFEDKGLNNLDLYLMRADEMDTGKSIDASISEVDSVEHIFFPIPQTGRYKIRVVYRQQVNQPVQSYGLAWWTVPN